MKIVKILFGDRKESEECCGIEFKEIEEEVSTACCTTESKKENTCC
jgi:hypothetical protein